jgi:hypothetical protein
MLKVSIDLHPSPLRAIGADADHHVRGGFRQRVKKRLVGSANRPLQVCLARLALAHFGKSKSSRDQFLAHV